MMEKSNPEAIALESKPILTIFIGDLERQVNEIDGISLSIKNKLSKILPIDTAEEEGSPKNGEVVSCFIGESSILMERLEKYKIRLREIDYFLKDLVG